jgi:O-antigen/teichoic acid export membrane protein
MTIEIRVSDNRQRTQRLVHNILGGLIGRVFTLAAPFLVMPVMLRYLGDVHFGIWMTAVAMTSVAQFSDLGIGNGLLTRLSAAFGRDDDASARSDIASAYATLAAVALILAVVTGTVLLLVATHHTPIHGVAIEPVSLAIVAAAFGAFLAGIPAGVIQRIMYARQRVMLSNAWQIAGAAFSIAACWVAVAVHLPPWSVVLAYSLPPVITMVVSAIWYFARNPNLQPRIGDIDIEPARALLGLGMRFLTLGVLTSIALNADNLIIAANAGARAVTEYSVPAKIGSLLGLVITTVFLPLWPANGEALARGDFQWVRGSALRMVLIGGACVAAAAIVLTSASSWIIQLWMGRSFPDQQLILGLLGSFSVVMALSSPYQMVLNGLGIIRPQILAAAIFLLLSLPLKLALVTSGKLWMAPLISTLVYATTIAPVSCFTAIRALRRY